MTEIRVVGRGEATTPPDTATIDVFFDPSATAASGVASASVLIDNLDVTTGGGAGRGANDADDVVLFDGDFDHHLGVEQFVP